MTPLVSDFNARAANGQQYWVVDTVATPDAMSPAPIIQGGQSSGKVYFDVTGAQPDSVVYNDGTQDVLTWTNSAQPPNSAQAPNSAQPRSAG